MSKTIVITGSTDGIGKLTALKLAEDGHQVYIHGRSEHKVSKVIEEIKSVTKNQNIFGFIADFSDLQQVDSLASKIKDTVDQLDVLINNAGVFKSASQKNENGLDLRFVVNYLAPHILTQKLTPVLNNSSKSRVINLSSAAQSEVVLKALEGSLDLTTQEAYAQSKLALTMWSFNYAKAHKNINTIAVNPGSLLNTKMVKEAYGNHWSSADKGANILYDLAISEKFGTKSGSYFDNDRGDFNNAHPDAYNDEKINALLSVTETILAKIL